MEDTESCSSTGSESNSTQNRKSRLKKTEIYQEVLQRMKDFKREELSEPGFEDELWNHFNRLPMRYATDVNIEGPEDVLRHMKLLQRAYDSATKSAFEVRSVQVPVFDVSCSGTADSNFTRTVDPETSDCSTRPSRPTLAFGVSPKLELALEASKSNGQLVGDGEQRYFRAVYEITISTIDMPKLLSQLTSLLADIGLNIQEAHAFSTSDGYSLDVFVVDSLSSEGTEHIIDKLETEIPKIENISRSNQKFKSPAEVLKIPTDGIDVWELDHKLLKFDYLIAGGSCKELYKGTYGSQDVAIKVLTAEFLNADMRREFAQEVYILRKVRHKNVVQFIGASTKPPRLCIVTEFMSRGSVYDYIHKQKHFFKLPAVVKVAIDVSKGMNYLHQNKIVHRDLKAANLLMDENDVVKVADFGVAKVQSPSGVMTAETGTYRWMAPEVIEHKPYDRKADVFSFGIVLWELLTGKLPYDHLSPLQAAVGVVQQGLRPTVPTNTNPKMVQLLERCWQQDPSSRPEFSEITEILINISNEVAEREKTVKRRTLVGDASRLSVKQENEDGR
ncbi:hypothetical protein Vadar_012892 [Vaccinium darrowii]|uniref:Uncharacterized protein n=1 Tax=Vaccinium darrowii TaxID=229202 RepID=A0ACB7Y7K5_9ERIC|nr:hypothetical protein Vadar_012892 [Vaccinium darrowii]